MILRNATLPDGTRHDIEIKDGRIAAFLPPSIGEAAGLVLPPLVDGHIHLDKTLLGLPWVPNQALGNGVSDRIEAERKVRAGRTVSETETGANLVKQVMASGTLHMRTHVDVDNELGLRNLQAVLAIRERFKDLVTIEIVAFPQSGIARSPGTAALLDEAVAQGADLVGGLDPVGIDGDLDGHLDTIFGIASRRGVGIDIHLHDGGEGGLAEIVAIARRTRANGLKGKVAISHAFALGSVPTDSAARTADLLAETGVAIMSHGPGAAPMPPVKLLKDHGVEVFGGSDNIRDAWSPFGNGDMLDRAMMIGYRATRVLGLADYGLNVGGPADFVVVDAAGVPEAVAARPRRKLVVKAGRVIAKDGVLALP
jgi:cytosine deaminase